MLVYGLKRRGWLGWPLAVAGCELTTRGFTGRSWYELLGFGKAKGGASTSVAYGSSIRVDEVITINKSPEVLYRFWRNFANLPRFMQHLESVDVIDERRSHWVVKGPAGLDVEWNAEVINDIPNRLIGWRSIEPADVDNAGSVHFDAAPGRGTQVRVTLRYDPPAGSLGAAFARMLGEDPAEQVREDLLRFQQLVEMPAEVPA